VRSVLPRLAAALAIPLLLLTACANADGGGSSSTGTSANKALDSITVTGEVGSKPTVKFATKPTTLTSSGSKVVTEGTGARITKGQEVTVDYLLLNGKDGSEADTSFGKSPATFTADPAQLLPGLANGMIGKKVGSRVLVGIAPKDGFPGGQGNEQLGFGKDDALIFVLDLKTAVTPLAKATGTPVAPKAGLPTVKEDASGTPVVTVPKTPAPKKLVVQPLIKGEGAVVEGGQTITAAYVGVIYGTGKQFDSSYTSGVPLKQRIGVGALVPGFDKGIVGQTVGSRVLLILPPAEGYGTAGNAQAGIKGTDTLVFVVDILAAA
jgi:peptidylprolyl isomerase